jgi:Na+/H+ antiporter NhaD/arsenite permease-like protein
MPHERAAFTLAFSLGSIFLLSLVLAASMMPVHKLPDASWQVALGLGFVSAVFDNIPLTALGCNRAATTGAIWRMGSASAAR